MTIIDLQMDIINAVLRVTDMSVLSRVRDSVRREVKRQSKEQDSIWKGAATELLRGMTFEDLMEG